MSKCRKCGALLTDENWYPSLKQNRDRICISCYRRPYNPDYARDYMREYYSTHRKVWAEYGVKKRQENKIAVFRYYSGNSPSCADPFGIHEKPFTIMEALSIDHVNGGGTKHLREVNNDIYRWLVKNNFPEGFQVLCMNCQFIKAVRNKERISWRPRKYHPQVRKVKSGRP